MGGGASLPHGACCKRRAKAVKTSTDKNVADMMTKCSTATVMNKLQMEIDILAQLSDLKYQGART